MNANDLADRLEQFYTGTHIAKAAEVLRQQADLIRNLQKSLGFKNSGYETINLTPQLELTDDEIVDIGTEFLAPKDCDIYTFARAILRKAQE